MIDWTKTLELMDGTPVRLETDEYGNTNRWHAPDSDGDYWIERVDGGRIVSVHPKAKYRSYRIMCVHPNGCEEGTEIQIVRISSIMNQRAPDGCDHLPSGARINATCSQAFRNAP